MLICVFVLNILVITKNVGIKKLQNISYKKRDTAIECAIIYIK